MFLKIELHELIKLTYLGKKKIQGARDLDHVSLTLYIFIPEYRRKKVKVCAGA